MNPSETYQLIFENAPHCVKVVSADGHLLNMNKAGLGMIGAEQLEQVFKHHVSQMVHPEDYNLFWEAHERALQGEKVSLQFRVYTLAGEERYMQSVMNPAGYYWNDEWCVLSLTHDVTAEVNARKAIEFQAFLLNSVQQAVIATSLEGTVIYMNSFAEKLYGYTREELVGKNLRVLSVDDPIIQEQAEMLMRKFELGESWSGEFLMRTKSGRIISVYTSSSPIYENGKLTAIMGISFDISEKKRAELEREDLIAALTQRNQDLKQFGYIASHNMRAPVTNLLGLFSLLDKTKVKDEGTVEIIEGMERSTQNLNSVLNDLIKILNVKENAGGDKEVLVFEEQFNRVLQSMSDLVISSRTHIQTDFSGATEVRYQQNYLQSLFHNLITNSIKFKRPDIDPVIHIKTTIDNGKVKLVYTDNGLGFDMELVKDRVFGMHQRFHKHPESKGLGLYLIKTQLKSMGGTINLASEPNNGSTFTIKF